MALLLLGGTASAQQTAPAPAKPLPRGVIRADSLIPREMMIGVGNAVKIKLTAKGYQFNPRRLPFQPYLVSSPRGSTGQRRWTERWIVALQGKEIPFTVEVRELGPGLVITTVRE